MPKITAPAAEGHADIPTQVTFENPPLARLLVGEASQLAERGSFCWRGMCGDAAVISTSSMPLQLRSSDFLHLSLPLDQPPDKLSLSALFVSAHGGLQGDPSYDYIGKERSSWSYEKPGRTLMDLGTLPLKLEQDIKLSLESGYYVLIVSAVWRDYGDVQYGFLIEVQK